jgi:hypothetical protein
MRKGLTCTQELAILGPGEGEWGIWILVFQSFSHLVPTWFPNDILNVFPNLFPIAQQFIPYLLPKFLAL